MGELPGPPVTGLLLDIDGVLTVSWHPLPGAAGAVAALRALELPLRFLTNTTSRTRRVLAATLTDAGIAVTPDEILNAPSAAAAHLRRHRADARCWLLTSGDVADDLEGVDLVGDDEPADVVLLGGAGPEFTYERLDHAFRLLHEGAELVAMHRNLTWQVAGGLSLDSGAYVAGLEAATGVSATVVGKPAGAFFAAAVDALGTPPAGVVMVGDDVEADVGGAQAAGLRGVLVRTGKFRPAALEGLERGPDAVVDSVADLPALLGG